jgi:SAM-dependent methyltransferase
MTPRADLHRAVRQDGPSTMPSNESGWWEEERARFIRERVAELAPGHAVVADVGCGRGRLLADPALDGRRVVNIDSHIWDEWRGRDDVLFVCASADALPFRDEAFDLVGSFDVLEHLPDDRASLIEQRRVTRSGGSIVAAVPADPRLWSGHDVAVGHFRRYDETSLADLASRSGLEVARTTYFFSYLWLPAFATRRRAARAEPGARGGVVGAMIRRAVGLVSTAERAVLRRWRMPFGTSLWAECRRGDVPE